MSNSAHCCSSLSSTPGRETRPTFIARGHTSSARRVLRTPVPHTTSIGLNQDGHIYRKLDRIVKESFLAVRTSPLQRVVRRHILGLVRQWRGVMPRSAKLLPVAHKHDRHREVYHHGKDSYHLRHERGP